MSITLNDGTVLRNLEEQVQYLTNYHDVNQGLAQWGIKVVGQVETAAELPDPATYQGEYGDTYAVGTEAPFSFYIFTRAAIVGESPYWFPFGEISIVGPQGPKGDKGDKGDTGESTKWITSQSIPQSPQLYNVGDLWLNILTGEVSQVNLAPDGVSQGWRLVGNIRGPQGIQGVQGPQGEPGQDGAPGPMGPQGDVGGFINIWGILANSGQLPTPASLNNLTVAYLIGAAEPYNLYIQVGESSDTAIWQDTGPFNAATAVSVGGVYQNVWDADTKLDKVTGLTQVNQAYIKTTAGNQEMFPVTSDIYNNAIVRRSNDGDIYVNNVPVSPYGAVNKVYVDNGFIPKVNEDRSNVRIVSQQPDGTYLGYVLATNSQRANQACIPLYLNDNTITTEPTASLPTKTPTVDYAAANKKYVDDRTPIASNGVPGLLAPYKSYGTVATSGGILSADTLSPSEYEAASVSAFIGKGTLQNVIGSVACEIIVGGDNFKKTIPAYLKQIPSAYVGACCTVDDNRHVLMGYDEDNTEFIVFDTSDGSFTTAADWSIQ